MAVAHELLFMRRQYMLFILVLDACAPAAMKMGLAGFLLFNSPLALHHH